MLSLLFQLFFIIVSCEGQSMTASPSPTPANSTAISGLLKAHGIIMMGAWGIILPFGISLALMCKSICTGKRFMIAHLVIMIIGILIAFIAVLLVLFHANFTWLNGQALNNPHQVIGLLAMVALIVNPMVAAAKPNELSKWRPLFNLAHGGTGMFLALIPAYVAIMFAVHLLPGLTTDAYRSRVIIILTSILVGYIIFVLALYNIYVIRYHKDIPAPTHIPGLVKEKMEEEYEEMEEEFPADNNIAVTLQSSPDSVCRVVVMIAALLPIIVFSVTIMGHIIALN